MILILMIIVVAEMDGLLLYVGIWLWLLDKGMDFIFELHISVTVANVFALNLFTHQCNGMM